MKIAVASGKPGTGKTMLATGLASVGSRLGLSACYVDCGVEAPNGCLLLHPRVEVRRSVTRRVPLVDHGLCGGSGVCASVCQFGGIVRLPTQTLVHPELCTSCGVCVAACPHGAIHEVPRSLGKPGDRLGRVHSIRSGDARPGPSKALPVVEDALSEIPVDEDLVVIDAPAGTTSSMIAALRDADLVVVVSDATLFGRVDFGIILELVRRLGVDFGVVINRSDIGDHRLYRLCAAEEIPIFGTIPYSRSLARAYAQGSLDAISPHAPEGHRVHAGPRIEPPGGGAAMTRETVVVSGKGGTGKTSITASLASLGRPLVLAGCHVDTPDLELLCEPRVARQRPFTGGKNAWIDASKCWACGACELVCGSGAIRQGSPGANEEEAAYAVDPVACDGCGACVLACPEDAIHLETVVTGAWFLSETRFGPMVHARLNPGEGDTGRLVSIVRDEARTVAEQRGLSLVLLDGAPGVGAQVMAMIVHADLALVVAEATLSGLYGATRVLRLARDMGVDAALCVNRWDLHPELADRLEADARALGATIATRIRDDPSFVASQRRGAAIVECARCGAAADVARLWGDLLGFMAVDGPGMRGKTSSRHGTTVEAADGHWSAAAAMALRSGVADRLEADAGWERHAGSDDRLRCSNGGGHRRGLGAERRGRRSSVGDLLGFMAVDGPGMRGKTSSRHGTSEAERALVSRSRDGLTPWFPYMLIL